MLCVKRSFRKSPVYFNRLFVRVSHIKRRTVPNAHSILSDSFFSLQDFWFLCLSDIKSVRNQKMIAYYLKRFFHYFNFLCKFCFCSSIVQVDDVYCKWHFNPQQDDTFRCRIRHVHDIVCQRR